MIFDYNPITGLNYYTYEEEILYISLAELPTEESLEDIIEKWRSCLKELGMAIIDSSKPKIEEIFMPIYSNVPYEVFRERIS